jgi:hypothetical protein
MASGKSSNNQLGTGCLILFGLPFFAVGLGMTGLSAWTALRHSAMQSWVEVPATIKTAELKADRSHKNTSFQAVAAYDYEFEGRKFKGERVSIDSGSDNVGTFQQDAYQELKQHLREHKPFHCFVDPQKPSDAVLYRDLRGEMLAFYAIFATTFGAVGLGLITAVIAATRQTPTLKTDVPDDAPWTSRADWETGLISSSSSSKVVITTLAALAIYWSIAILPLLWKLPEILAHSRGWWKWSIFVFPLIDAVLVASTAYFLIRWRKFGESTLLLASTPGVIGGQLAGVVRTHKPVVSMDGFRLTLNCLDWLSTGNNSRSEVSLWQDEQLVMEPMQGDGEGTAIPVLFAIPISCRETTRPGQSGEVHWRLDISARVAGVDYAAKFDVPVFKTAESRADFKLDDQLVAQLAAGPKTDVILREAGIIREPLANGVRLEFPMARHMFTAAIVTVFLAIWLSATWAIHFQSSFMAIFFGLFGLIVLFTAVDLWFYRSVVEASPSGLLIRGGLLGIGRTRLIPVEDIREFTIENGMSSGANVWNNIRVLLRDGKKRTIGRSVTGTLAQRTVISELSAALHATTLVETRK